MFPVEIRLVEPTEKALTGRITSVQKWLDSQGFEPSTFRYTFFEDGLVLRVDFAREPEAMAFADEFHWLGAHLAVTAQRYGMQESLPDSEQGRPEAARIDASVGS